MIHECKHCGSELRDTARYCDQCGRPLVEDATLLASTPAAAQAPKAPALRPWLGLLVLLVVLGALYLLLKPAQTGPGAPISGAAGAGTMKDVLAKVESLKAKLKRSPGDTATLAEMYGLYAEVGKASEVTPHLDAALAALEQDPQQEGIREKIAEVAEAAMSAGDDEGLLKCLESFHRIFPDDTGAIAYLGDQCFRMGRLEESIAWYDSYLEVVDPHKQADEYYGVYGSRASTRIEQYRQQKDNAALEKALEELEDLTVQQADRWAGWYYYGEALRERGDKLRAREAFATSQETAKDGFQRWQAEAAIARLDGKPEPPMPNPHGAMGGPPAEGDDPHAGMGGAHGQMPDDEIHAGGSAGDQMPADDIHQGAGGGDG